MGSSVARIFGDDIIEAARKAGHMLKMDTDGSTQSVDEFFLDQGYCNGPGCEICHWSCCMHCGVEEDTLDKCTAIESTAVEITDKRIEDHSETS